MGTITLKYFGAIAEQTGKQEEMFDFEPHTVESLKAFCESRYPELGQLKYQIAVNKKLNHLGSLQIGDEIAFLPPFAGG